MQQIKHKKKKKKVKLFELANQIIAGRKRI